MGNILDGRKVSEQILDKIKKQVQELKAPVKLCVVQLGENVSSDVYINIKRKKCEEAGIQFLHFKFAAQINQNELITELEKIQMQHQSAIIIQLPLPQHLQKDQQKILNALDPEKDVDVLTQENKDLLEAGASAFEPPAPAGILELLKAYDIKLADKNILLVGQGELIGKPLGWMLKNKGINFNAADEYTSNVKDLLSSADLIISGVGKPYFIKPEQLKEGVVLVDAGTSKIEEKVVGDIHPECYTKASYYSPVPGGVGPMTVAMLLKNVGNTYGLTGF